MSSGNTAAVTDQQPRISPGVPSPIPEHPTNPDSEARGPSDPEREVRRDGKVQASFRSDARELRLAPCHLLVTHATKKADQQLHGRHSPQSRRRPPSPRPPPQHPDSPESTNRTDTSKDPTQESRLPHHSGHPSHHEEKYTAWPPDPQIWPAKTSAKQDLTPRRQ